MTLESNILSKFEHKYGKRVADVFKNVESRKKILNLVDRFKKVGESK
jgi:hypothetical protein